MNNDFISILGRMKDRMETEADKREGTWTADNLQAVANELARIYSEDIESILPQAFVITATGQNLDSACSDYGITRRAATAAEVMVELSGEPGTYYGVQLSAGDIFFYVPEAIIIPGSGTVTVRAVCEQSGDIGNVAAGSIIKASTNRITKAVNPEAATGGYDTESDDALRERTLEHIRTPANSGNIAHYIQWAKEVPGVSKVKVYDLARGPGTVDVAIIADGNEAAPESLLQAVEENIEAQRPIGADVLVLSGQAVDLDITADVVVSRGYTAEAVRSSLYPLLQEYCEKTAFHSQTVSYLGLTNLLFDCPGVLDVRSFSVNGGVKSIRLSSRQFPVPQLPEVTAQEERDA